MSTRNRLVTVCFLLFSTFVAAAKPINVSAIPDVAIYKRNVRIVGFTLSIWGENPQYALSLGVINGATGDSSGLMLGIFNYADEYNGGLVSAVNWVGKDFTGVQAGLVNFTHGLMTGLQLGPVNYAKRAKYVQLGVVNYAESAAGFLIQLGVVNVIPQTKSWFREFPHAIAPFMLLTNWRF